MLRYGAVLIVVLACGCGLEEYQEKMKKAQQRIKAREDQDQVLGGEVILPKKLFEEKGLQPKELPPLFLRWPKGLSTTPDSERKNEKGARNFALKDGTKFLYVYSPPAQQPGQIGKPPPPPNPQAPPPKPSGPFYAGMLGFGVLGFKEKEFAVRAARQCVEQGDSAPTNLPLKDVSPIPRQGLPDLKIKRIEFEAGAKFYSVNVWSGNQGRVAVVYVFDKAKKGQALQTVNRSLETFAAEGEAARAKNDFIMGGPLGPVPEAPPPP